jgi:hypothetical protein
MRGRNNNGGGGNNNNNNNNRKGPNPLSRNYESNGPDVKIRGSAQQIAEKYAALARDAMSSGDRVMAENYLQHAEHYNRIIAAAQAQMPIQHIQPARDEFDDDGDEDREDFEGVNGGEAHASANNGSGPQPVIEGTPAEVALNAENAGENRGSRDNRENSGRENSGRENGGGRNRERRQGGYGQNGQRNEFRSRNDQDNSRSEAQAEVVTGEESQPVAQAADASSEPVAVVPQAEPAESVGETVSAAAEESPAPRRARRPRRPRATSDEAGANAEAGTPAPEPAEAASES